VYIVIKNFIKGNTNMTIPVTYRVGQFLQDLDDAFDDQLFKIVRFSPSGAVLACYTRDTLEFRFMYTLALSKLRTDMVPLEYIEINYGGQYVQV
jgi:hypothetical protein